MSLSAAVSVYIKFFFLLTPFFILAVFLALTEKVETRMQRALAGRVTVGIVLTSILLFLFGETIFDLFGITVDSFRIGAGALLFLSAVSLTQGKFSLPSTDSSLMSLCDCARSPFRSQSAPARSALSSLPPRNRPSYIKKAETLACIVAACLTVGLMLFVADRVKSVLGANGIAMLSKITGLVLAALSCQLMFTGIAAFLK